MDPLAKGIKPSKADEIIAAAAGGSRIRASKKTRKIRKTRKPKTRRRR